MSLEALLLAFWLFMGTLLPSGTAPSKVAVLPPSYLVNPGVAVCGEADLTSGQVRLSLRGHCWYGLRLAAWIVAHEWGHLDCWLREADVSEECADARAAAWRFPRPIPEE